MDDNALALAQFTDNSADCCFVLPIYDLASILRREHDMVLTIPNCVC